MLRKETFSATNSVHTVKSYPTHFHTMTQQKTAVKLLNKNLAVVYNFGVGAVRYRSIGWIGCTTQKLVRNYGIVTIGVGWFPFKNTI